MSVVHCSWIPRRPRLLPSRESCSCCDRRMYGCVTRYANTLSPPSPHPASLPFLAWATRVCSLTALNSIVLATALLLHHPQQARQQGMVALFHPACKLGSSQMFCTLPSMCKAVAMSQLLCCHCCLFKTVGLMYRVMYAVLASIYIVWLIDYCKGSVICCVGQSYVLGSASEDVAAFPTDGVHCTVVCAVLDSSNSALFFMVDILEGKAAALSGQLFCWLPLGYCQSISCCRYTCCCGEPRFVLYTRQKI